MHRVWWLLVLALAVLFPATPAQADTDQERRQHADELAARAKALGNEGRWDEALPLFAEAYQVKRSYDIAGNLGLCEAALSRWRDAAAHLTEAVDGFPQAGKAEHRALLYDKLEEVLPHVAVLQIQVSEIGATVLIDGAEVGQAPLGRKIFVEPGPRIVVARLTGFESASATVNAAAAQDNPVQLTLAAQGSADGPTAGAGAATEAGLDPFPIILGAGYGATAVGLVMGIVFTVASNSSASDADDLLASLPAGSSPCAAGGAQCDEILDLREDQQSQANIAGWSFVAAGVVGIATTIYALVASSAQSEPEPSAARLLPIIGPDVAGLTLSTSF